MEFLSASISGSVCSDGPDIVYASASRFPPGAAPCFSEWAIVRDTKRGMQRYFVPCAAPTLGYAGQTVPVGDARPTTEDGLCMSWMGRRTQLHGMAERDGIDAYDLMSTRAEETLHMYLLVVPVPVTANNVLATHPGRPPFSAGTRLPLVVGWFGVYGPGQLEFLAVHPAWRHGKGAGRLLLHAFEHMAALHGVRTMRVHALSTLPTLLFYVQGGWIPEPAGALGWVHQHAREQRGRLRPKPGLQPDYPGECTVLCTKLLETRHEAEQQAWLQSRLEFVRNSNARQRAQIARLRDEVDALRQQQEKRQRTR